MTKYKLLIDDTSIRLNNHLTKYPTTEYPGTTSAAEKYAECTTIILMALRCAFAEADWFCLYAKLNHIEND